MRLATTSGSRRRLTSARRSASTGAPDSFNNKLVVRGGYGLNFNQDEIAITANLANNPPTQNFVNYSFSSPTNPGTNGGNIIYAISSDIHSLNGFPPNPHAITSYTPNGLPTAGSASVTIIGDGYGNASHDLRPALSRSKATTSSAGTSSPRSDTRAASAVT